MLLPRLRYAKELAALWLAISKELIRHQPTSLPILLAKTLASFAAWRIRPNLFFMNGLQYRPLGAGRDYMKYFPELLPGLETLNWQGDGRRLVEDKVLTAERLIQAGIPTPPITAVIGRDSTAHPHAGLFREASTLEEVLDVLSFAPDLLIAKPAGGTMGVGIYGPERDGAGWRVDDVHLSPEDLARRLLADGGKEGLLLQPRLRSHRDMEPIGGELGLSSARIATALTVDGPEIFFAWLKIMGSKGLIDNFCGGVYGNMIAGLDEAGRITRVYYRKSGRQFLLEEGSHHPVTGTPLIGFQVPLWEEAVAMAKRTAAAFPENPFIGLDVAFEENGPMIIETNANWDANSPQLVMEHGIRPMLRDLIPRMAVAPEVRAEAARKMHL